MFSPRAEPFLPAAPRIMVYVDRDLVGDALIKLPFLRALRHAFPDATLTWVAGRGATAYAGALAPLVAGLLDRALENTGLGADLAASLGAVDLVIDTQSKLATARALRRLGARRFIAPAGWYVLSQRRPRAFWRKQRPLIRRLLGLVELASGRPAEPFGELPIAPAVTALAARLLAQGARHVAQVPGAGGRHKAWPLERHIDLGRGLLARGILPAIILGPAEPEWHAPLRQALPGALFPLQDAAAQGAPAGPELTVALARRCAAAVAGDCGGGHMMAAADIPLISLFGPTDPGKFAPWTRRLLVLRAQDWGSADMAAIPVSAVAAALSDILRG
jgi:ADP-heptose:LPS heptosyltransferase